MEKKYVTLEEAQKLLPQVQKHLIELVKLNRTIELLSTMELQFEDTYRALYTHVKSRKEYHKLCLKFFKKLDTLFELGCIVKDINLGLVDFYAKHGDKDIFLCWKFGEPEIRFWHDLQTGYSGRRPVESLERVEH